MNSRTAAALCIIDLAPLIEAGDFCEFRVAEGVIDEAVASIPIARHRAFMLYRVGVELNRMAAPDRPEADAYLRAVKATVRQRQRHSYERRLTARAAGA